MKKFFIFIIALFITTPAFAIDPGIYIGVGGSFAKQDFNINSDVSKFLDYYDVNDEFDNTSGMNLKVGYRVNDISSWELSFDSLPGFNWNENISDSIDYPDIGSFYGNVGFDAEVNIMTFMLVNKLAPNFGSDVIRPFITAGIGLMYSELKVDVDGKINSNYDTYENSQSYSDSEISPCFKLGTGIDLFIKEYLSVGFEVAYVLGTGTLTIMKQDIIDECNYVNYTFGVAYYF